MNVIFMFYFRKETRLGLTPRGARNASHIFILCAVGNKYVSRNLCNKAKKLYHIIAIVFRIADTNFIYRVRNTPDLLSSFIFTKQTFVSFQSFLNKELSGKRKLVPRIKGNQGTHYVLGLIPFSHKRYVFNVSPTMRVTCASHLCWLLFVLLKLDVCFHFSRLVFYVLSFLFALPVLSSQPSSCSPV